jgi:catalase
MINAPVFPVSTPQIFYELLRAEGSKEANAVATFAAANPEFAPFGDWAKNGPWTGSYAEERYNSSTASSSSTVPAHSTWCAGRCCQRRNRSLSRPMSSPSAVPISSNRRLLQRVAGAPQRWTMVVTGG